MGSAQQGGEVTVGDGGSGRALHRDAALSVGTVVNRTGRDVGGRARPPPGAVSVMLATRPEAQCKRCSELTAETLDITTRTAGPSTETPGA